MECDHFFLAASGCLRDQVGPKVRCNNETLPDGTTVFSDPRNDFVALQSKAMDAAFQQRLGDSVARLPTVEWTRNLTGPGRHVCARTDRNGVHLLLGEPRRTHLYQVWVLVNATWL